MVYYLKILLKCRIWYSNFLYFDLHRKNSNTVGLIWKKETIWFKTIEPADHPYRIGGIEKEKLKKI